MDYSYLKDSTGLAVVDFIAWKLTVARAINKAMLSERINIHKLISILYAKS
ncbi:MAG: hypothetical protein P8Z35_09310 [Ignavibacteriaceae bacterium]